MNHFLRILVFLCLIFLSSQLNADPNNDQWKDTNKTYHELIQDGFEVKAYDISNFKDAQGNMYMFFVTVLQKERKVIECQEYQIFDQDMNTVSLTFVCRELVFPYKRGLDT